MQASEGLWRMSELAMKCRLVVSSILLTLALIGLAFQLARLHLGTHEEILAGINRNRQVEEKLLGQRGNIYDRNGKNNILALDVTVQDVCADPKTIIKTNGLETTSAELAQKLDLSAPDIMNRLNRPAMRFAYVQRFVDDDKAQPIRDDKLTGVFFRDSTIRYYPHSSLMCHVLGFVNYDGIGSAGTEQYLDKHLRGAPGTRQSRINALGHKLYWEDGKQIAPQKGADVYLSLDQNVQYIVEKALDEAMLEHHAKGAWAIVERVHTGEILAMASRPALDLNKFSTSGKDAMLNSAIGRIYEPGSSFKATVIASALNDGTVTPDTVFDCEDGAWLYNNRVLHDFHPYGKLTVADGLQKSSNILTAKVALMLGEQRLYRCLKAFGIGEKTGVDLPGEEQGILHPVSKWSNVSATRIAIGQGVSVTALQILNAYCAIANDGYLMRPYVVNRVTGNNDSVLLQTQPEVIGRPISFETAATMKKLLTRVTEEGGTGLRAQVEGYEVAGKTGSAQKPVNGGYSTTAYTASFVGFLPAEDPEIGVIVVVDEPQPIHLGGVVACPVFSKIASQTVRYLDIPPAQYRVASRQ
jgi:cell division protein FtsI (penicillin-binding protein 3)